MTAFVNHILAIFHNAWEKAPALIITFIAGYLIIKLISFILGNIIRVTRTNQATKSILTSVIDIGLWLFLISALLQQIGLSQIALALSGSTLIVGLAISTGSSAFVQDLVSGLFLAQDPDFSVGDRIKTNDVEGVVERMDARKIRIRDDDALLHIFPNSVVDKAAWIVVKKKTRGTTNDDN